jgi:hypothetical protein
VKQTEYLELAKQTLPSSGDKGRTFSSSEYRLNKNKKGSNVTNLLGGGKKCNTPFTTTIHSFV